MKKTLIKALALVLCLLLLAPSLFSCDNGDVIYKLGGYAIRADEYNYLLGMQKKQAMVALGYTEDQLDLEIKEGYTVRNYIDDSYSAQFEQSVLILLFSVALFDEYGLSIDEEKQRVSDEIIDTLITYYGGYSEKFLNKRLSSMGYGFSTDTLRRVYQMQLKQDAVLDHLYGSDYSRLSKDALEQYCDDYYMHFQVLIVNTLYKSHTDSEGNTQYVNLTEDEIEIQKRIATELTELLVNNNKDFNYIIIDPTLSYEELWEKYSDDTLYPQGYFMRKPASLQSTTSKTIMTAFALKVGDCGAIPANRYFDGNGTITTEDGKTTIKKGDYFEYGTAIIKKLDMEKDAYSKEENKDFFPSDTFMHQATQGAFYKELQKYENESSIKVEYSNSIGNYSISGATTNELDYYYFFGS